MAPNGAVKFLHPQKKEISKISGHSVILNGQPVFLLFFNWRILSFNKQFSCPTDFFKPPDKEGLR